MQYLHGAHLDSLVVRAEVRFSCTQRAHNSAASSLELPQSSRGAHSIEFTFCPNTNTLAKMNVMIHYNELLFCWPSSAP